MPSPAFNAPPGVYRLTTQHHREHFWCHNPECADFGQSFDVDIMYEHDTGAYYERNPECPTCGLDGEEKRPSWVGQCSWEECPQYGEPQDVIDECLDDAYCSLCDEPLTRLTPEPLPQEVPA